jgi:hypothetical protein
MIKFPSVTVLEPAASTAGNGRPAVQSKVIADNENRPAGGEIATDNGREDGGLGLETAGKVVDSTRGESGRVVDDGSQPEEVIEVDAAPQQSEQPQQQQQAQGADVTTQQPSAEQQQPTVQVQKWFPEVPSVFFQVIIIKRKSSDI